MKKPKACLLVVDDEKVLVDSIEAQFIYCGFEVIKATDSKRALALSDQIKPDIIIADIRMPKLDGITFLKKFKEVQPDVKVISMTGYFPQYEKQIREAEAIGLINRVIQKPFHALDLEKIVYDLLKTPEGEMEFSRNAQGKILIVDDEVEVTDLLRDFFSERGYAVSAANSAREGLASFETFEPNVVFTDIKMPAEDGIWLIKELRSQNKDVRIIVITGQANQPTLQRLKEETGIEEYFSKPFSLEDLEKLTQELFKESQVKKIDGS